VSGHVPLIWLISQGSPHLLIQLRKKLSNKAHRQIISKPRSAYNGKYTLLLRCFRYPNTFHFMILNGESNFMGGPKTLECTCTRSAQAGLSWITIITLNERATEHFFTISIRSKFQHDGIGCDRLVLDARCWFGTEQDRATITTPMHFSENR